MRGDFDGRVSRSNLRRTGAIVHSWDGVWFDCSAPLSSEQDLAFAFPTPFAQLRLRENVRGVRTKWMRREYIIAFLLMLASIPTGVAVNAAADYFPALHAYSGTALVASIFIMALLLVAAVIIAIRGERNAEREGKERRMIPFVGMILCGLGFVAFGAWYFWRAARAIETVAASPLNDVVPSRRRRRLSPQRQSKRHCFGSANGCRCRALFPAAAE
jgi:MFS family permease